MWEGNSLRKGRERGTEREAKEAEVRSQRHKINRRWKDGERRET